MQRLRETGRTFFSPLDLLNRYKTTGTDTVDKPLIQEQHTQSEVNGQQISRSPTQKLADAMLEKYHAKMFIPVIKRFFPSLDLASMLAEVDDAIKWHNALLDINKMLEKALMEDHEGGFVSECYCEGLKYD